MRRSRHSARFDRRATSHLVCSSFVISDGGRPSNPRRYDEMADGISLEANSRLPSSLWRRDDSIILLWWWLDLSLIDGGDLLGFHGLKISISRARGCGEEVWCNVV